MGGELIMKDKIINYWNSLDKTAKWKFIAVALLAIIILAVLL